MEREKIAIHPTNYSANVVYPETKEKLREQMRFDMEIYQFALQQFKQNLKRYGIHSQL